MADLADLDLRPVRKALTVVGEPNIHELRGLSCLPPGALPAQRKGCAVTRSFSIPIEDRATLEQAVSAHATRLGVAKTWRESGARPWRFGKPGIVTTDLMLLDASPRALIGQLDRERSGLLMAAVDACNARFGRGSVVPAHVGLVEKWTWSTKFEMRTPRYTTQVSELPIAVAG
ncbi:DUF4113 domain-containing protein [Methylobacterium sp. WL120]|nr:DUF4113 domain-containing protein [Methylobacterium sp. WL120]